MALSARCGGRVCEEERGEGEREPDPADFDEVQVEDVVFAGEVVYWFGLGGCGVGGLVRGRGEDGEEGAEDESCRIEEQNCAWGWA